VCDRWFCDLSFCGLTHSSSCKSINFYFRVLERDHGIHTNMTLLFNFHQVMPTSFLMFVNVSSMFKLHVYWDREMGYPPTLSPFLNRFLKMIPEDIKKWNSQSAQLKVTHLFWF